MRFCRFSLCFVVVCLSLLTLPAVAQTRTGARRTSSQQSLPKPDRRLTLLVQILQSENSGQLLVQATSNATLQRPFDLTGSFPLALTPKTKLHFLDHQPATFIEKALIVVRADLYGVPPAVRAVAREIWDVAVYDTLQHLRKDTVQGTVVQGLTGNSLQGELTVTRADGTQVVYRVTDKSRFCRDDKQVYPSVYQPGMPITVKPRALPGGGVMASVVAESSAMVDRAYRDTLSIWEGILERAEIGSFYFVLHRNDGATRQVRFPQTLKIQTEADAKKPLPGRTYVFSEIVGKPIVVRLMRGERPDTDGTRTATSVLLTTTPENTVGLPPKLKMDTRPAVKGAPASQTSDTRKLTSGTEP